MNENLDPEDRRPRRFGWVKRLMQGQTRHNQPRRVAEPDLVSLESEDNASTTPMKSVVSIQSTSPPSILSQNQESNSYNASTAETSIAPSTNTHLTAVVPERDSESIVTLASSSRRTRRRSIDTNCSTAGIPPASIMERLSVHPNAANSSCAVSVRTSQIESYDSTDQTSTMS